MLRLAAIMSLAPKDYKVIVVPAKPRMAPPLEPRSRNHKKNEPKSTLYVHTQASGEKLALLKPLKLQHTAGLDLWHFWV